MLCRQNGRGSLEDGQRVFLLRLESGRAARPLACRRRNKHKAVGKNQRNAKSQKRAILEKDHPQKRKAAQKRQERSSRPHRISGEALGATGGVENTERANKRVHCLGQAATHSSVHTQQPGCHDGGEPYRKYGKGSEESSREAHSP